MNPPGEWPKTLGQEQVARPPKAYRSEPRPLVFPEVMPKPMDWDEWCRWRHEQEVAG